MTDIALEWNDDFAPDSTGDLQTVDSDVEVRQRLERRLFTADKGYVWHPEYGAGLPEKIGSVLTVSEITAIVTSQLALEQSVAPNPPMQIQVAANPNAADECIISIQYWDALTGATVSFSITT